MAKEKSSAKPNQLDCCPEYSRKPVCDTLRFRYRLPFKPRIQGINQNSRVEVILHFELERCSGPLVIGDPHYSTTLLPGERVRLYTRDRHSRWSFDSESSLAYRHETTSEESFFTFGMARAMSDLTVNESASGSTTYLDSWAEGGGGGSLDLGIIEIGGGGGGGSYDAESLSRFSRSLSRHAESSSSFVAASVRAKSSTAIGEVERRNHAEGESESHFESSSRVFRNRNKCHAVTYFFHKVNKLQTIRFKLIAIERRVVDPVAPTGAYQRTPVDTTGRLTVMPQVIRANAKDRLEVEDIARSSVLERQKTITTTGGSAGHLILKPAVYSIPQTQDPISLELRQAMLAAVDQDLAKAGILDARTGKPTAKIIAELSWEREEILPTPGFIVKGCLDKCDTCEPTLSKAIHLNLERKRLENELLKRQIELLDQSQEYRCCPNDDNENEVSEDD